MKIQNIMIIVITLIGIALADNNIHNQIENDHRIRNFAFIGPFPKDYNADSLIKTIKSNTFSLKNSITYKGINYQWIKPPAANGDKGSHSIWHYYKNIKVEEIVIGVAIVNSKIKQEVITEGSEWYCRVSRYFNGEIIYNPLTANNNDLNRATLNKGNNIVCLKIVAVKEPGINLLIYPETSAEVSGKVTNKDGSAVPFARVRFYEINKEEWSWDNTDMDGNYTIGIFPIN